MIRPDRMDCGVHSWQQHVNGIWLDAVVLAYVFVVAIVASWASATRAMAEGRSDDLCARALLWVLSPGRDVSSHEDGKDGISICRELVTSEFVAFGALVGLGALKGERIDSAAAWAFVVVSVVIWLGLLLMRRLTCKASESMFRYYYNPSTRRTAFASLIAVSALLVFGLYAGFGNAFDNDDGSLRIIDASHYTFSDKAEGIQLLVQLKQSDIGRPLSRPMYVRVEMLQGAEKRWEVLHSSTGFIGDPDVIRELVNAEVTMRAQTAKEMNAEQFSETLKEKPFFVDNLQRMELGYSEPGSLSGPETFNPSFPAHTDDAKEFDVFLDGLPSAGPVVLQFRLYPKEGAAPTDQEIEEFENGVYFRALPVTDTSA